MYRALARWCFHRRWLVIGVWIALIIGLNVAGGAVGSAFKHLGDHAEGWDDGLDEVADPGPAADSGPDTGPEAGGNPFEGAEEAMA